MKKVMALVLLTGIFGTSMSTFAAQVNTSSNTLVYCAKAGKYILAQKTPTTSFKAQQKKVNTISANNG